MTTGAAAFGRLKSEFAVRDAVESGQMFGKPCMKVGGKAWVAQQQDVIAFKLSGADHASALAERGSTLWDPSGKGRPMKEWVAIPAAECSHFRRFAEASLAYVKG
jgi:hypothetical protein